MDIKKFANLIYHFNGLTGPSKVEAVEEFFNNNNEAEAIDIVLKLTSINGHRPQIFSKNHNTTESLSKILLEKKRFAKKLGTTRQIFNNYRKEYRRIEVRKPLEYIDYWKESVKISKLNIENDDDFFINLQDYYDALIIKWNDYNHDNSKKIDFGVLSITYQYNNENYFTVREKLEEDLQLDKIKLLKNSFKIINGYGQQNFISRVMQMKLTFYYNKKTNNTQLKAYDGKVKRTKGAIFSPVLYNWNCCISEIALFLKYRNHYVITKKLYKHPYLHDWAYLNMFAVRGNLFSEKIKQTFYTANIKDFIMEWNSSVKICDIVLFNSVTSEYFPVKPQSETSYVIFWYPYHVEIFTKDSMHIEKPKTFIFKQDTYKAQQNCELVICTLDIETYKKDDTGEQIPYLICIHSDKFKIDIALTENNNIIDEFITILQSLTLNKNNKYIFWAHNGMKFDYIFLLPALVKVFDVKLNGKIGELKCIQFRNIKFLDFFKFFNTSLNNLAKTFLNKSKLDFDFETIYDKKTAIDNMNTAIKYCKVDCEILYELVIVFNQLCEDKFNISIHSCFSASHLAKSIFQKHYLDIKIKGSILTDYDIEKESYHGGMTISYYKGYYPNKIYVYDINSSYPYSMLFDMPVHFIKQKECTNDRITSHFLYFCTFSFPEYNRVCNLSVSHDGELLFLKQGSGWYWGCELILAKKLGAHIVLEIVRKYKPLPIFKEYILTIYEKRKQAKAEKQDVLSELYKKLLNSLYGKFGQKLRNTTYIEKYNNFLEKGLKINDLKLIDNETIYVEYKNEHGFYNNVGSLVRLSSYITALSRCTILEPIIGMNHDCLLYMDTDSIFLTKTLANHYLHENELGKLKKEEYKAGIFISSKNYMLYGIDPSKNVYHMKGVNIKNVSEENYKELITHKFTKVYTLQSIKEYGKVRFLNKQKTVTALTYKRRQVNNYTYPHLNIAEFLIYKKEQIELKKLIPKDKKILQTPSDLIKESNLILKQLHNPDNLPIVLPHREEYNKLPVNEYLKHRMLFYCKSSSEEEKKMLYDILYKKQPNLNEMRITLAKFYGFHLESSMKYNEKKSMLYNLKKNGYCNQWKLNQINNTKKIFANLQYNFIKKTI